MTIKLITVAKDSNSFINFRLLYAGVDAKFYYCYHVISNLWIISITNIQVLR
jgi:hypothetical protein